MKAIGFALLALLFYKLAANFGVGLVWYSPFSQKAAYWLSLALMVGCACASFTLLVTS